VDTRHLQSFIKVAELLNFTKAASELAYAQSTVTAHIRSLEREFGVELFHRTSSTIKLTPDGEKLLSYAKTVLDLTAEARENAQPSAEPAGKLFVGTMESLSSYRLLPLMEYMHLRYPTIELQVRPSLCEETSEAIRKGTLDCGFVIDDHTGFPGLENEILCVEEMVVVASPADELAHHDSVTVADFRATSRVLGAESGCAYRDRFQEILTMEGEEPFPVLELGTIESIKRGAASGLGVAVLPRVTVENELTDGTLVALPWAVPFTMNTQILWRRVERLPRPLQALLDVARKTTSES
jgi:DNA-binding transcriptional LysR family regulator